MPVSAFLGLINCSPDGFVFGISDLNNRARSLEHCCDENILFVFNSVNVDLILKVYIRLL